MKVIPISLTLKQLKELCQKRVTELCFRNGATVLRLTVKMEDGA